MRVASAVLSVSLAGVCAGLPGASEARETPTPPAPAQVRDLIEDGRYAEAENLGARLLRDVEARHGVDSLQAAGVLDLIVEAQWRGGTAYRPEALERAERAVKIRTRAQGSEHSEVARSLIQLGQALLATADYPRAEEVCGRAVALSERALGANPGALAESLQCLGRVREVKWDYPGAAALYERAVSILEKGLGSSHPMVALVLTDLGITLRDSSELARAREVLERALRIQERALRPAHPDVAQTLTYLGIVLAELGQVTESKRRLERAVQISEQSFGAESPQLASALNGLTFPAWEEGDCAGAIRLEERALAINEKAFGPDHHALSVNLYNLAASLREVGEYARAKPLYERALALDERYLGPEHPDVAWILRSLGELARDTGDLPAAVDYLKRALALQEKALGPEHPQMAYTLNLLAWSDYGLTGSYAEAKGLFERALAIYEKAPGRDEDGHAFALQGLARLVARTGRYEEARPIFSRALALRVKTRGWDHPYTAWTLGEIGWFHVMAGELSEARSCFEKALPVFEKGSCPNPAGVANALHGLAETLTAMGDFAEARRLYEQSLSKHESALGPDHPWVGSVLGSYGELELTLGDYPKAQELFERALPILERAVAPDKFAVGGGLISLAIINGRLGHLDQAKSLFQRGLAIREKAMGSESFMVAWSLVGFGEALLDAGQAESAAQDFERALSIYEKAQGPDSAGMARALAGLAEALAWKGETERAFETALRAEEIGRRHLGLEARALAERQALRYSSVRASGLGLALSLASSAPRPGSVTRAWDALVRSRSLVLDEMAARHHRVAEISRRGETGAGERGVSEITRLSREVVQAGERLSRLMVRGPESMPLEQYRSALDQARREQERTEQAVAEASGVSSLEASRREGGLAQVMSALPHGSVLLAYARYDRLGPARPGTAKRRVVEHARSVPSYLALVQRWDRKRPEVARLGPAREVEDLTAAWRSEIARGATAPGTSSAEAEAKSRAAGDALRRKIWDPVAGLLRGATRVFVVPDGALHLVNLAALPVSGGKYLIEGPPVIHYLSAERDLIAARGESREGDGLLALGGPNFEESSLFASLASRKEETNQVAETKQTLPEAGIGEMTPEAALARDPAEIASTSAPRSRRSPCGLFESMRFEALPGSEREVEDIATLWQRPGEGAPGAGAAQPGGPREAGAGVVRLTGPRASEALFKEKAPGRRVLHLATHGFFLPGRCESTSPSGRGIGGISAARQQEAAPEPPQAEEEHAVERENPLLLSGLALAGANHRDAAGPDEEDGILTAEEIAAMDLSGVEWAVLSACDTGLGEVKAGEGVLGLRRAFQAAGVKTLIMSLWPVEDEAAREWMKALYEGRLVRGLGTAEAVREASLTVLNGRRSKGLSTNPVSWASFVATGDWR